MRRLRGSWVALGLMTLVAAIVFQFSPSDSPNPPVPSVADSNAQDFRSEVRALDPDEVPGFEVAQQLSSAFEYVAESARPFVVNVTSTARVERPVMRNPFGPGSPLEEFFGRDFFDRFRQQPPGGNGGGQLRRGQGTGFVVSADGYILTNNHVVEGADEVTVRMSDERDYRAEVIGTDPKTDLAVLKIEPEDDLQAAPLGDSDALRVGEWVVAAGNPFGLSSSVTAGIVSAKGRANMGITDYEDFIQTDAAINPGNSGGPLLNLRGEVVGINTAILSRSGGYMGVGFAIPVNMARSIMTSLIEDGRVVRGWLGVAIQRLDPDLAESFGYGGEAGVLIAEVNENTPASRAGLESGDIVVAFDGDPVESMERFRADVAATRPGSEVELEVFRDGSFERIDVEIGELEGDVVVAEGEDQAGPELGITARAVTPQIARELGLDPELRGVVVTGVEPLSPAARAGLRRGDVIQDVQGAPVRDLEEFRSALTSVDTEHGVRLAILRGGTRLYILLKSLS